MDILQKMKKDWDRRADHHAKFWIAIGDWENDDIFHKSGIRDMAHIFEGLETDCLSSWRVLEIGCGIGRLLKPLSKKFSYVCGVDVSGKMNDHLQGKNLTVVSISFNTCFKASVVILISFSVV